MKAKRKPIGTGDYIVFPRGHALWTWEENEQGQLLDPYVQSNAQGFKSSALVSLEPGARGRVVEERYYNHERLLRLRLDNTPDCVVSPGRDSLYYRRAE